jgi:hypothetical protein
MSMEARMKLIATSELSRRVGVPNCTFVKMVERGVLPRPDVPAGRVGYYSDETSAVIQHFFASEYKRYRKYPSGHVRVPVNEEVAR